MKLLQPDTEEMTTRMRALYQQGNREAGKAEKTKMVRLRKMNGVYPLFNLLNLAQLPIHITFISLINKLSFDCTINPAITSEGFLWFTDLTSPDPYGILPIVGASLTFLNMLNSQVVSSNETFRKVRRYMFVLPLLTGPVWMTFPVAFNLYWMISSGT